MSRARRATLASGASVGSGGARRAVHDAAKEHCWMTVAGQVPSRARSAEVDPELWAAMEGERRRQHDKIELIASENYTIGGGDGGPGQLAHQQVRGGPARAGATTAAASSSTSPRTSPASGPCGSSRAPSTSTSSRTPVPRPTWPLTSASSARRPDPRDEARPGRPSDPRMKLNFSGRLYEVHAYGVREDTERIDYDALEARPPRFARR